MDLFLPVGPQYCQGHLFAELVLSGISTSTRSGPFYLFSSGIALAAFSLIQYLRSLLMIQRRDTSLELASSRGLNIRPLLHANSSHEDHACPPQERKLLLILVAYHPSSLEVDRLLECLAILPAQVGYAVVVNDHKVGEPVERLAHQADYFLANRDNLGYGRAANLLVDSIAEIPPYLGVLNTDLTWSPGTFEIIIEWMDQHSEVSLAVPQILNERGEPQKLCKQNPTILALLSRRFWPKAFKPRWLKRYDRWYTMSDRDYMEVLEAPYLSGCCMIMRRAAFCAVGGFDEDFFLYLEDADLTRCLTLEGKCVHLPLASVTHIWGRGNYRNLSLMAVNIVSAYRYFMKWGWALW